MPESAGQPNLADPQGRRLALFNVSILQPNIVRQSCFPDSLSLYKMHMV